MLMAESQKKPRKPEAAKAGVRQEALPKAATKAGSQAAAPAQSGAAKQAPETDELTDKLISPLSEAWELLKGGVAPLYLSLLKLNLARNIAYYLSLALLIGILFGLTMASAGMPESLPPWALFAALLAIGLFAGFLILWMVQTFESAAFILVRDKAEGRPYSMRAALGEASSPTFRFVFVDIGVWLLLFLPLIILAVLAAAFLMPQQLLLGSGANDGGARLILFSAYILAILYVLGASLLYTFITQFWRYGFLLQGRGVVESLKASLGLIRENPLEVVLFDLIVVAASVFASIPSYIFGFMMYFVLMFVQVIAILALGPFGFAVYFAAAIVVALLALVFSTITDTVCRPLHYMFWRRLTRAGPKKA